MRSIAQILLALMPLFAVPGWDCRRGWELLLLWGAAAGISLALTSGWRCIFLWLALFHLILNPAGVSYATFGLIVAGLLMVEAFKAVDPGRVMQCMAIGAGSLGILMALQLAGVIPVYSPYGHAAGLFNPGSAGVYLALCLPAFVHIWWAALICLGLIAVTHSTTAMVTGFVVVGMWTALQGRKGQKGPKVVLLCALAVLVLMLMKLDPLSRTLHQDPRWSLWRQTVRTFESAPFGRGLGSYQQIMPYFIANNADLAESRVIGQVDRKPVLSQDVWWNYAHNEYLQAGFELGMPGLIFGVAYVGAVAYGLLRIRKRELAPTGDAQIRAGIGIAALAVSSLGWFPLHEAPLAIAGLAWIAMWESENRAVARPFCGMRGFGHGEI